MKTHVHLAYTLLAVYFGVAVAIAWHIYETYGGWWTFDAAALLVIALIGAAAVLHHVWGHGYTSAREDEEIW